MRDDEIMTVVSLFKASEYSARLENVDISVFCVETKQHCVQLSSCTLQLVSMYNSDKLVAYRNLDQFGSIDDD